MRARPCDVQPQPKFLLHFNLVIHINLATIMKSSPQLYHDATTHILFPSRPWSGEKRYVKGDLVVHRGRVHECASQSCSLEPQSLFSVASCALFSRPLVVLNAAVVVLAVAVALLLWLVRYHPPIVTFSPPPRLLAHLLFAGVYVGVLDSMLGCCAFALWNSCVASQAAATGYVVSCCGCDKLRMCCLALWRTLLHARRKCFSPALSQQHGCRATQLFVWR
jgi:hypothetical protein